MRLTPPDISVIGGGAAGFFAAISAAESNSRAKVTIFEAGSRVLRKVAVSGGGRCNVTHACFDVRSFAERYPRGSRELLGPLTTFQAKDTVEWFAARGVKLKTEEDNRIFPITDDSATVIECLADAARRLGVMVRERTKVTALGCSGNEWQIHLGGEQAVIFSADRVLLATGSSQAGYQLAQSVGHTLLPPVPSLFSFKIEEPRLTDLSGISVASAQLKLLCDQAKLFTETGPLLITHAGVSGPAVLKISAFAARHLHQCNYQAELQINWTSLSQEQTTAEINHSRSGLARRQISSTPLFSLPRRLWERLVANSGIALSTRWADLSRRQLSAFVANLVASRYRIAGKNDFKDEFVTCGGVTLTEVNLKTMESKLQPGLFFAGEILDIDGLTGGFNLQAAWTTGAIAGRSMAAVQGRLGET